MFNSPLKIKDTIFLIVVINRPNIYQIRYQTRYMCKGQVKRRNVFQAKKKKDKKEYHIRKKVVKK